MILNGQIVTIFVQPVRIKISLSDRTNLYLSAAFELAEISTFSSQANLNIVKISLV